MKFLLTLILLNSAWALPGKVEVWFLSADEPIKTTSIEKPILFSRLLAINYEDKCIPMGEGCFHPQLGFIEKTPVQKVAEKKEDKKEEKKEGEEKTDNSSPQKTFNSDEVNLVDCKEGNYFDVFCGKDNGSTNSKAAKLEVWIDTSSSLRNVDYSADPSGCQRKVAANSFVNKCSRDHVRFVSFDTAFQEVGDFSVLCNGRGGNETKRIISWIKNSNAKSMLLITDIDEANAELKEFLDSVGAKTQGAEMKRLYAKDLKEYSEKFAENCK